MSFPLQAMPGIHNGLDALWHHHYQKAEKVFQELGEQGDAHAMYWLGNTYQLEGGMKRLDAGEIFLKAANMGDPWAMYRLYTKNPYSLCTVWPCSSKWDSKAAEIWEKQSKEGNGKATFALVLRKERTYWYNVTKWLPGMGQEQLNQMALKAFHQGYQGAAVYLFNHNKSANLKYLTQAAKNNFIPAYAKLAIYYKGKNNINFMNKYKNIAIQSGDTGFIKFLFDVYIQGIFSYKKDFDKAYYYGKITTLYGDDVSEFFGENAPKEFRLSAKVAKDKQIVLTQKAKEFVRTHPPYHYYDEFSFPIYAMRF
ncbi:sel1 repeat family protein [Celerinatantimonas diazotrophica]|uniref:sel1 repeat family protein n=1 Tax=Celerinatantimonas diazotrophica TaxID=412034 RepID=UPI001A9F5945|nr:sel1 repeat family protein [Celerinatantimonas diazotrophica]